MCNNSARAREAPHAALTTASFAPSSGGIQRDRSALHEVRRCLTSGSFLSHGREMNKSVRELTSVRAPSQGVVTQNDSSVKFPMGICHLPSPGKAKTRVRSHALVRLPKAGTFLPTTFPSPFSLARNVAEGWAQNIRHQAKELSKSQKGTQTHERSPFDLQRAS